jgi:polyhydroxyalkanoate synthase subunit PhaC
MLRIERSGTPLNSDLSVAEALVPAQPAETSASAGESAGTAAGNSSQEVDEFHPADRAFHAALARLSGGISPIALMLAYAD